jgi:HD-like signal output (HDOD) protein
VAQLKTVVRPGALRGFAPFDRLDSDLLIIAATRCEIISLGTGALLVAHGEMDPFEYYLIEGTLSLTNQRVELTILAADDHQANRPVATDRPTIYAVRALTSCAILRFPRHLIGLLWEQLPKASKSGPVHLDFSAPGPFLKAVEQEINGNRLLLCSLPAVAIPIRRLAERTVSDTRTLARILALDPVIALKIIKIATSPLFSSSEGHTHTLTKAIEGLCPDLAAELAVCYSLKHRLPTQAPSLLILGQQAMVEALHVAAIARLLAQRTDCLDPERAFLAGLFHNIGIWLLLSVAATGPEALRHPDALHRAVRSLAAPLSALLLERLPLGADLTHAAAHGSDFRQGAGEPFDLAAIVRIARYHFLLLVNRRRQLPRWTEVPAFRVFPGGEFSPEHSLRLLADARLEIAAMNRLLSGELE